MRSASSRFALFRILYQAGLPMGKGGADNPRKSSIAEFERVTPITELVSFHAFGQPTHDRGNTGTIG